MGAASGCIRSGGSGPSRVSDPPARTGGPAAARASPVSTSTGAVAVDAHSPTAGRFGLASNVPRALWYSTSSLTSWVFSHSHATAKAPARIGPATPAAQRDLAAGSAIAYR